MILFLDPQLRFYNGNSLHFQHSVAKCEFFLFHENIHSTNKTAEGMGFLEN